MNYMIKKYIVNPQSGFNKSLMLPFYERCRYGFHIDGLDDHSLRILFDPKYLKVVNKAGDIDPKSLPTFAHIVYLDDELNIRALVMYSAITKQYYCARVDHQDEFKLKIQNNYIDKDSALLEADYEKSLKKKGINHFDGLGDFNDIKDINYYDYKYSNIIAGRIDKKSNISRLIFFKNNSFIADFVRFSDNNKINIVNKERIANQALSLDTQSKLINNRKDCLFVNFNTGKIEYLIYTYRPNLVNHYLLFKCINEKKYEFIKEDICFNKLLLVDNLCDIQFKDGSEYASEELSGMNYDDFVEIYKEFEEDERVEELIDSDFELYEKRRQTGDNKFVAYELFDSILRGYGSEMDDNLIYFNQYETTPLAYISNGCINIQVNRLSEDAELVEQIPLTEIDTIETSIDKLLFKTPSSRLATLHQLVEESTKEQYDPRNKDHNSFINEIDERIASLWPIDHTYPEGYLDEITKKYNYWKDQPKRDIEEIKKGALNTCERITIHGSGRSKERIANMNRDEILALAQEAYSLGTTPAHYIESDPKVFRYLSHQQNKHADTTLRVYKGFIFIFGLRSPYPLITCYAFQQGYDHYKRSGK